MLKGIAFYIALFILFISPKLFGETITTGNLLTNSGFTGGTSSWTNHGTTQQHHVGLGNECVGSAVDNSNSGCGVSGSLAGVDNGGVSQTITLSDTTSMTQAEINNGFTSTMSTDIWFWHGQDTVTMKQELTDSTGNVSTQTRVVIGSHNNYQTYTDTSTVGTNTSTDYSINVLVDIDDSANSSGHAGPDVDNVTLNVNYTYIPPIDDTTQTIIDDIDTDIVNIIDDIPEDFDWYNDEIVFEEEYTWEEDEYTWEDEYIVEDNFYFEEELDFEVIEFDSPPMFEDFEEFDMEEMPTMEEVFFETEFMEEPPMMTEEIFTEEFEEDFTSFIEETGLEEEFEQFLEEEGITAEEFFEEITEEEFNDELTEESFDEFEEPMEEIATNEESVPEVIGDEEEAMEEPTTESMEEEQEVANNEQTETKTEEETESSSEGTDESEVSTEDSGEQEEIQSEGNIDTDKSISKTVAKIESKLKQNLKKVAKQIAQATKQSTQNLSKEDLFFNNNNLNAYLKTDFYKSKDIYTDTNLDYFNQIDLGVYSKDIYTTVSLNSYVNNDPVEIHNKKIQEINIKKRQLLAELEALKQ